MIYLDLFLCFVKVGLFSIGGGYAAMPLIQAQTIDRYGWLSMNEFTDLVSIAEMTPGPIAVNAATFIGSRLAGLPGALIATFGAILPSLIIVSLLFLLYNKFGKLPAIQTALAWLRPAVTALIASAGLTILLNAVNVTAGMAVNEFNFPAALIFVIAFVVLRKIKPNPILVMLCSGAVYTAIMLILTETAAS